MDAARAKEKMDLITTLSLTAAFGLVAAVLKTLKNACDLWTSYVVMRRTS